MNYILRPHLKKPDFTKIYLIILLVVTTCLTFTAYGQTQSIDEQVEKLGLYFEGKADSHPLDQFELIKQDSFKHQKSLYITKSNIELRFTDSYGSIQSQQFSRDLSNISKNKLSLSDLPRAHYQDHNSLELYFRDGIITRFNQKIETATFFNEFLVFIEKNSYDKKNGVQHISFVDLNYLEKQLGNGVALPIFKLSIKASKADTSLQIQDGKLSNNNILIDHSVFKSLTPAYQMIYNMQANLVDPLVYEEIAESGHLDDLITHFKRAMNHQIAHVDKYIQNSAETSHALKSLKSNSLAQIEQEKGYQKDFYSIANNKNKNQLSSSNQELLKKLEQQQEKIVKTSAELSKDMASKRKLMARINIFISKLNIPRPDGAPSIKKALAFVSTSLSKDKKEKFYQYLGGKKEAYRQLTHYGAKGTLVAAAALTGLIAPEVYGDFFYQSLQLSQAVAGKVGDLFSIIGTGVNQTIISLGKDIATTATDGFKETMIYDAYINGGRLKKTGIAAATVVGVAVIPAAISHVLINSTSLLKDFKESGVKEEYKIFREMDRVILKERYGKFLGGFLASIQEPIDSTSAKINGFIDFFPKRQNRLQMEYLANSSADSDIDLEAQKFDPTQDEQVREILNELKSDKKNKSWLKRLKKLNFSLSKASLEGVTANIVSSMFPETGEVDQLGVLQGINSRDNITTLNRNQRKLIKTYWKLSKDAFVKEREQIGAGDWVQAKTSRIQNLKAVERELVVLRETLAASQSLKKDKWISRISSMRKKISSTVFSSKSTGLEIKSFGKAFSHFLLSYATMTKTIKQYVKVWNLWFGFRSFVFQPKTLFTLMYYPNYFSRVTGGNLKISVTDIVKKTEKVTAHYPSSINGAKRNIFKQVSTWLVNPKQNKALLAWEDKIIEVEQEVYKFAFQEAINDISLFTQDINAINAFISHGGPQRIDDRSITKLHWKYKTFFRKHFKTTFDASMELYLKNLLKEDIVSNSSFSIKSLKEYKEKTLHMVDDISVDKVQIKKIVLQAKKQAQSFEKASSLVKRLSEMKVTFNSKELKIENYPKVSFENFKFYMEAVRMNIDFDAFSKLNARNNNQVKRMLISARQVHDPQALVRAVRYTVTHFVNDKPMQLLMLFLLSAGIPQGELLQPVQNDFIGPNSIGYLSKFVGGMFAYDIVMSLLNTAWMKLQVDASHAKSFGYVPSVEVAKKGAMHWFLNRTFKYKENSTMANQKIMNQIITDNLQAALVNTGASNLAVLNRFDVDSYITGYMLAYFPGYYGFSTQLDQGIDMSMGQILSEIPEELRSHPEVMNYYKNVASKRRLIFNFLYHSFYENPLSMVLSNITNGQDRALARWTFGGFTPTELIAKGLDEVKANLPEGSLPSQVVEACNKFFTNNYTNWTKYKRK